MKWLKLFIVVLFFSPLSQAEDRNNNISETRGGEESSRAGDGQNKDSSGVGFEINPLRIKTVFLEKPTPGKLVHLRLQVSLEEGFFAYENQFRLKITQPENSLVGELFISPIVDFDEDWSRKKEKKRGIKNFAKINTQVQIPENRGSRAENLSIRLTYVACTKKFCLTPRFVEQSVPIEWETQKSSIKKEIGQSISKVETSIEQRIQDNLLLSLFWIFFFGFLTSLTPCIYPLIPITLAVLGGDGKNSRWRSFLMSLNYVLGIAITYALLGVVAARTGKLFGSIISHPIVIGLTSLILFAMGLSLLGFFEVQTPSFIRNPITSKRILKSYSGVFVSGLLAGVIASPCVGPVLVGILAFIAHQQDSFLGFTLLFTFAMGFGSLFIILGFFGQLAGRLPRSGPWMKGAKTLLALCLFGLSFYYVWPLLDRAFSRQERGKLTDSKSQPQWKVYTKAEFEKAKGRQPIIIDFFADWCLSCMELDELTFSNPVIIEKSKKFAMFKVDATIPSPELEKVTDYFEVYGLPTILFIDSRGEVVRDLTLSGFESAELFQKRMDRITDQSKNE